MVNEFGFSDLSVADALKRIPNWEQDADIKALVRQFSDDTRLIEQPLSPSDKWSGYGTRYIAKCGGRVTHLINTLLKLNQVVPYADTFAVTDYNRSEVKHNVICGAYIDRYEHHVGDIQLVCSGFNSELLLKTNE